MGYVLANREYLIDTDTWKFVPLMDLKRPFECEVPFPYWKYGSRTVHRQLAGFIKFNVFRLAPVLHLNNLHLQVNMSDCIGMQFTANGVSKAFLLSFRCNCWRTQIAGLRTLNSVEYRLSDDGSVQQHMSVVPEWHGQQLHKSASDKFESFVNFTMQYMVSDEKFKIAYKGRKLELTSYVIIFGPWAILLSDSLEFDSLVYLSSVTHNLTLDIEKVAYSVNPYIVKMVVLNS